MLASLEGSERAVRFADALMRNELGPASPAAAIQDCVGVPHGRLSPYRAVLAASNNVDHLVLALHTAAETFQRVREADRPVEVAWTYPGDARPGLRTTGGVARDVIDGAKKTLLVVGYSVTVDPALAGLAAQTVSAIAHAGERGVVVTGVLHRTANREALLRAWPAGARRPGVFTWPEEEDEMAAIHAKLLVADRTDALVTSANLTYHGFERNLEMGVRVGGRPAAEIHDRFFELIAAGDLIPWPGS